MSLATFWLSMTKMESLSDQTLLAMHEKVLSMIGGRESLASGRDFIARLSERELSKLDREQERIQAEMKRRGMR